MQQQFFKIIFFLCSFLYGAEVNLNNFIADQAVKLNEDAESALKRQYEMLKPLLSEKQKKYLDNEMLKFDKNMTKILTIFYFTSTSLSGEGAKKFNRDLKKLSRKYDIQGMVVLNGFPKDLQTYSLGLYEKDIPMKIKVHPYIYEYFNLREVPAYAISACRKDKAFRFKDCENFYLAKGDASLEEFFRVLSQENNAFDELYNEIIRPDIGENQ